MLIKPAGFDPSVKHPLLWVPSLYLAMGLPNVAVSQVSKYMYKNLGISNTDIVLYTSLLYLPWVLKPLWAPFMEPYLSKRKWVLGMEFLLAGVLALVAATLPLPAFFKLSLVLFWVGATSPRVPATTAPSGSAMGGLPWPASS